MFWGIFCRYHCRICVDLLARMRSGETLAVEMKCVCVSLDILTVKFICYVVSVIPNF